MRRLLVILLLVLAVVAGCCSTITLERGAALTVNNYINGQPPVTRVFGSGDNPVVTPSATTTTSVSSDHGGVTFSQRIGSPNVQASVGITADVPVSVTPVP